MAKFNKDSVGGTLTVVVLLSLVCSLIVAGAAVLLKPTQEIQKQLDKQKNILQAAGLMQENTNVQDTYAKFIEPKIVDLATGDYVDGITNFDAKAAAKDPAQSIQIAQADDRANIKVRAKYAEVYLVKDENGKPQVPFKTVYVTGLIRDEQGQKMSKSKGNVLDPIDMIDGISLEDLLEKRTGNMMQPQLAEKIAKATRKEFVDGIAAHGTDALRFTLAALASNGRDINWDMKRLEGYRNFCNKLWNASRFVLTNDKLDLSQGEIEFSVADRWIQSEFNRTVETFRNSLSQYRFDLCANAIYEFTWNQFCDWYLELTKPVFANGNAAQIRAASQTLVHVLEKLLRLAHPLIPFITEEIWQKVKGFMDITADSIMLQSFPQVEENGFDPEAEAEIEWLKEVIVAVRNIRAESNIAPSKGLDLLFRNLSAENAKTLGKQTALLKVMAKLDNLQVLAANEIAPLAVAKLVGNAELLVPMAGFINKEAELARLTKEIEKYQNEVKRIENKLSNEAFVAKAPEAVIAKEREKQAEYQSGLEKIQEQYKAIEAL